jgi:hypothetical protein
VADAEWWAAKRKIKQKSINNCILKEIETKLIAISCSLAINEPFVWGRNCLKRATNPRVKEKSDLVNSTCWLIEEEGRNILKRKGISANTKQLTQGQNLTSLKNLCESGKRLLLEVKGSELKRKIEYLKSRVYRKGKSLCS